MYAVRIRTAVFALATATIVAAGVLPQIDGTNNADTIDASYDPPTTDNAESIDGRAGNDLIRAKGGNDEVLGGPGNDEIFGGGGNDLLKGNGQHDKLHGDEGNDTLEGGQDNDQLYGGTGNDTLLGGPHWDYLDGNEGADTLDGGTNGDILLGRDGNDTLIGGSGDDILVILGSSTQGYTIKGDNPNDTGTGDNLLMFVKTWNPQVIRYIEVGGYGHLEITSFSGRTDQPVTVDLGQLSNIDTVVTGSAGDNVKGADRTTGYTYLQRFYHSDGPNLQVHELLLTGPGNDTIDTRNGDDYVDAGEGNDTIKLGAGECYVISGPGNDTMTWEAAKFNATYNKDTIVADLEAGDVMRITGSITPQAITMTTKAVYGAQSAVLKINGSDEIAVLGLLPAQLTVRAAGGGVEITTTQAAGRAGSGKNARRLFAGQGKVGKQPDRTKKTKRKK